MSVARVVSLGLAFGGPCLVPFVSVLAASGGGVTSQTNPVPPLPGVVINEIYYDPPDRTVPLEFIELHNPGPQAVPLAGWRFSDGVAFSFPADATIPAGGFVVVAENPSVFQRRFGFRPLGPWTGGLSNEGERLRLVEASGALVDEVTYGVGFPWPTAAHGAGPSMELVHPLLDRRQPGAWRSSQPRSSSTPVTLVPVSSPAWHFRPGTSEASAPRDAWRQPGFAEDATWRSGATSIGYGDDDDNTTLPDMRDHYTSVYLRHTFTVPADAKPTALVLRVRVDDGCVAWLNGHEIGRLHAPEGDLAFDATGLDHEATPVFEELPIANPEAWLVPGENVLAIQALNVSLSSSDLTLDAELRTPLESGDEANPTPGAPNSVYSPVAAPLLAEVRHEPRQPRSQEPVALIVRVTNPTEVAAVRMRYQTVDPGAYVRRTDPAFETRWSELVARDDGTEGDAVSGDGLYTAVIPASLQVHRRLTRYQVVVEGVHGATISAPYADDEAPNFAFFTYDGVPAWQGANRPGAAGNAGAVRSFPTNLFTTLPAYHLVANETDVVRSQWDGGYDGVRMWGTLVYDGVVYDHIQFHNRGEASTYVSGKNKWRFHFRRARELAARDAYGQPYRETWDTLNLNPCSSPWAAVHRGMSGLDEGISFRVYQLLGLPSSHTHHVQFRVVDRAVEAPANDQYNGDAWGLYLAVEHPNGAFLDERGLADGNLYKLEGNPDLKHQGATQPADGSDWASFAAGSSSGAAEAWWRSHLNLPAYYAFQAGNRVVGNVDLREGWNHYFYHAPDERWVPIPWDLDMQFIPKSHWSGTIAQRVCLNVPALRNEYRQRAREILDLLLSDASDAGGQIGQLIDEFADRVSPPEFPLTWVEFDQFLWNYHPRTPGDGSAGGQTNHRGNFFRTPFDDSRIGGSWVRTLISGDFRGSVQYLKDYCTDTFTGATWRVNNGDQHGYGYRFLASEAADLDIPATPVISSVGDATFRLHDLRFTASAFADPQGNDSSLAIQWRVAEIAAPGLDGYEPGTPRKYEVETVWESGSLPGATRTFRFPATRLRPGHTYRVRARDVDATGRAGHWSAPVQFVAQAPDLTPWRASLRLSEIMYHPAAPSAVESAAGWTTDDFQFVELQNLGGQELDLTGVRFSAGIDCEFAPDTRIPAGDVGLVVHNRAAFEQRYGPGRRILGSFPDSTLDHGGERLALSFGLGTVIHEVTYDDRAPWPTAADGAGASLERVNLADPDHRPAANWIASAVVGGTPGTGATPAGLRYSDWAGGEPRLADPTADADGDGKPNWVEFAQGTPALVADGPIQLTLNACPDLAETACIESPRRPDAEGVAVTFENSGDLRTWTPVTLVKVRSEPATAPRQGVLETWRLTPTPATSTPGFIRLRVDPLPSLR